MAAMAAAEPVSDRLLDFQAPFEVALLDATVNAFYGAGTEEQRMAAEKVLRTLQEHPDAWTRVDTILETSTNPNSKFFALQMLESAIKYRWNALPMEHREGIKNFISNLVVKLSTDEGSFRREHVYINKLNVILVQVLKHEWPARWPSFIPDLVGAARSSETLCENCMVILKLLSEEVFDFSRDEMTQAKTKELKNSLNSEFAHIHDLCEFVLERSKKPSLLKATLTTLNAFLSWIPLGYIFERNLLDALLGLFPNPDLRNVTLQCLIEVGSLRVGNYYDDSFIKLYMTTLAHLSTILPVGTNIPRAYGDGSDEDQAFLQNLALFLTGFFKEHIMLLERTPETRAALNTGLDYLLGLSYIEDTEVFKVCLDYWNSHVCELFQSECTLGEGVGAPGGNGVANPFFMPPGGAPVSAAGGATVGGPGTPGAAPSGRRLLYAPALSKLRLVMISRMAKPEEVLIVEDENGNIVRETMKDTDELMRYKVMRETLIYLANLDHEDTESQMLEKLSLQLNGKEWSWNNLNTLCWAVGSISGSMAEDQENRFLVTVIRDLLNLCEITRGKDHKAIIASNIMYVVGQYPRFLRAHWKFLKTVVNKLFEFMHELHPGVQDMACETFLKIAQKCKRKFVIPQVGEPEPFLCELLRNLPEIIADLEPHQVHLFYEAVGTMVQAENDPQRREEYLQKLMEPPNTQWQVIIGQARQTPAMLETPQVMRNIANNLQTNLSVCTALGQPFVTQISRIYLDMLQLYRMYSELVSRQIAEGGPYASRTSNVKLMRSVKKQVLRLIEAFVEKTEEPVAVAKQFIPEMMDPILGDYARNVPDARDAEVLSVFAAIINKLKDLMAEEVPRIFEAVFECTLMMITKNFEDYPDHRLKFFSLLRAITKNCFRCLFTLSPQHLKLVVDSIIWAIRHTERNVAETGLQLLLELLESFRHSEFVNQFHQTYFLMLESEIFAVITDTFHKPGFKLHVLILQHLFAIVDGPTITQPLWDVNVKGLGAYPSNAAFVREHTIQLLSTSFPNMTVPQITAFVNGLFTLRADLQGFKNHIRDFLVQSKSFAAQDNADLYSEEAAVAAAAERARMQAIPGMIAPASLPDEMQDT